VSLIEEVLSKAGSRIAGILDSIPGAVRRRVPSLSADEVTRIATEIARVRNIAAAVSLADLREPEEGGEGGEGDAVEMEAFEE
jgi:phage terminase Nu1 subunit (DNA packaging protein)